MNYLQIPQISLSPLKKSQQQFPSIYLKTTESPQKGQNFNLNQTPYQLLQNQTNNRKCFIRKDMSLEKAYTIRKYIQPGLFLSCDATQSQSKILQNHSITDQLDNIIEQNQQISSIKQIQKLEDDIQTISNNDNDKQQYQVNKIKQSTNSINDLCVLEQIQENEEIQSNQINNQEQLIISPVQQQNFNDIFEIKQYKQKSPIKNNIIQKFNQQNLEYKKYASQMIRMIKNTQKQLLKQVDKDILDKEKEYKQKKIERQIERRQALDIAQEGIKNRQQKLMLLALKGIDKKNVECPLYLNLAKRQNSQLSQSIVLNNTTSKSKIIGNLSIEKDQQDRKLRKFSMKSENFSMETSLEFPLHIQKII